MAKNKDNYQTELLIVIVALVAFQFYRANQNKKEVEEQRTNTDVLSNAVKELEVEKDSLKKLADYYHALAEASQTKADSLLLIYKLEVNKARRYYDKYKALQISNDTLTHSERTSIIRRQLAKRLEAQRSRQP